MEIYQKSTCRGAFYERKIDVRKSCIKKVHGKAYNIQFYLQKLSKLLNLSVPRHFEKVLFRCPSIFHVSTLKSSWVPFGRIYTSWNTNVFVALATQPNKEQRKPPKRCVICYKKQSSERISLSFQKLSRSSRIVSCTMFHDIPHSDLL